MALKTIYCHTIAMLDPSFQHVGDCLNSPVGMPGKTGEIILWFVTPKVIKDQKRVEEGDL